MPSMFTIHEIEVMIVIALAVALAWYAKDKLLPLCGCPMTDRKKPGVAFWSTVLVAVVLLYPISFGPACWITSRTVIGAPAVSLAYRPMMWAWEVNPKYVGAFLAWYAQVGAD